MTQSSPTIINDITDLHRILDEQPQWADAIRSRLLSPELLAMPQRLAQLTEQTADLREVAAEHTRQLADLREVAAEHTRQLGDLREVAAEHTRQLADLREVVVEHTRQLEALTIQVKELREVAAEHTRQLAELREVVAEHTRQLAELTVQVKELRETAQENTRQLVELRRVTELQTVRMNRMESDISKVKGLTAQLLAERTIAGIADELDLFSSVQVPAAELAQFARQLQLDRPTRRSFINADLIFLAQDAHDTPTYCAVEVSWTVGPWDLLRARRNAELLKQATGIAAQAVAAGDRYEDNLDWDGVVWFQLEDL